MQPLPRHRPLQRPPPVSVVGRGQDAGVGVRLGQLRGGLRHGRDRAPAGRRAPEKKHGVHASGPAGMYVLQYSECLVMTNHCLLRNNGKQVSNLIKSCTSCT